MRYSHAETTDENRGDENMSLAAQKEESEKFAQSLGLNVQKIYSEPIGTSVSRFSNKETKVFEHSGGDHCMTVVRIKTTELEDQLDSYRSELEHESLD